MLQPECTEFASIGTDLAGREQFMRPDAARAWFELRNAASADGVELQIVSAFRSVEYQADIIRRKRARKQPMKTILEVSAAPGYSEHHTGRALDLSRAGASPLEVDFENTDAFEWLVHNARDHGFHLSYPRGNRHSIAYEPWHWAWAG
jgi:D-alanyl-D-alanine carboxypeptidase